MNTFYRARGTAPKFHRSTASRLYWQALILAMPTGLLLVYFLFSSEESVLSKVIICTLVVLWVLVIANAIRQKFTHHIRTISNLLEAARVEDYNFRASRAREPGELGELYRQLNDLADQLQHHQLKEEELRGLLEKVIAQINVAIFVCDSEGRIRLVNPLATTLLGIPAEGLLGKELASTVLASLPFGEQTQLVEFKFPGADGRWQLIQQSYRHQGRPGKLLFITDLKEVLRAEESKAWQRLISVIAHEVNNSLTPITSVSQTLQVKLAAVKSLEHEPQILEGMALISDRAQNLKQFIAEYARIARLPEPQKLKFLVAPLLQKIQLFFADRLLVVSKSVPEVLLFADPVLIEQLLINLLMNAFESCVHTGGGVELSCVTSGAMCKIVVRDQGQGIHNPDSLFVPFYTTKQKGSGIGLALCRQIADVHQGSVSLVNREDSRGAVATLELPRSVDNIIVDKSKK